MREAPTRAIGRGGKLTAGRGEKLTAGVQVANDLDLPLRQTMLVFKNHLVPLAPLAASPPRKCACALPALTPHAFLVSIVLSDAQV